MTQTSYKEFKNHPYVPEPPQHKNQSMLDAYCDNLKAYQWISANPAVYKKMRKHPGVVIYKRIHLVGWILLFLLMWYGSTK